MRKIIYINNFANQSQDITKKLFCKYYSNFTEIIVLQCPPYTKKDV